MISDVVKGIEWAVTDARENRNILQCVANLSIGGTPRITWERAKAAAVSAGLTIVIAAGNQGVCSPPRPLLFQPS